MAAQLRDLYYKAFPYFKKVTSGVKTCPFCGGEAKITEYSTGDMIVSCLECSAETLSVEDWNRRVNGR